MSMTYQETLDYLFNALPMFQRIGAAAFKKDLTNTLALCDLLGNPQRAFKSVHVAGTNGKGSTSHAMCSILMEAGYKVGLYTSPHLKSFTERIKINGKEISEEDVVAFVAENKPFLEELKPSFFEMTVGMAFWYFAKERVDVAVIEVGMGGRLDSTNVILPELSLITNIGYDHMQFLGDTLPLIAGEKAGIIKQEVPVVISQTQPETQPVFLAKAAEMHAPIYFADQVFRVKASKPSVSGMQTFEFESNRGIVQYDMDLLGNYQRYNLPGVLNACEVLNALGWEIPETAIRRGLSRIVANTGLKGRWQILGKAPWVICDTGHNEDGIRLILDQIGKMTFGHLWMVIGMVRDKDISKILAMLPKDASYVFCEASIPRALPAAELSAAALGHGLVGEIIPDVNDAIGRAKQLAKENDLIFIGGSTFVVAEIENL